MIYWVTSREIRSFDVSTLQSSPQVQLNSAIQANTNSRWAVVDANRLVLCGGGNCELYVVLTLFNTAYFLSRTGSVQVLPYMKYGHNSPGVIVWKQQVLVFGSYHGEGRECEGLSLAASHWRSLPQLHARRYGFTPAIWQKAVYLCGGLCSHTIEVYDGVSIRLLVLTLPEDSCTMACVSGDLLVVFNDHYLSILSKPETGDDPVIAVKPRQGEWAQSQTHPLLWEGVVYYFGKPPNGQEEVLKYPLT